MDLDAAADSDKSEDWVAIDGRTATSQLVIKPLQVLVYHKYIVTYRGIQTGHLRLIEFELRSRARHIIACHCLLTFAYLYIFIYNGIRIEKAVGNLLVEVTHLFESHLTDNMEHDRVLRINLAVLEFPFQHLLGKEAVLHLCLLQSQAYLRLGSRGLHNVQPFLTRLLYRGCENLHLITAFQQLADTDHATIDASTSTLVAYLRVNMIGEVEHGSTHRELVKIPFRRKYEHLVFV